MALDSKLRRQLRTRVDAPIRVCWQDRLGQDKYAMVHSYDISSTGIRLTMPEAVAVRTVVVLQSGSLRLHGSASVRYCTRATGRYVVGVEFVGGMQWQPPPV